MCPLGLNLNKRQTIYFYPSRSATAVGTTKSLKVIREAQFQNVGQTRRRFLVSQLRSIWGVKKSPLKRYKLEETTWKEDAQPARDRWYFYSYEPLKKGKVSKRFVFLHLIVFILLQCQAGTINRQLCMTDLLRMLVRKGRGRHGDSQPDQW